MRCSRWCITLIWNRVITNSLNMTHFSHYVVYHAFLAYARQTNNIESCIRVDVHVCTVFVSYTMLYIMLLYFTPDRHTTLEGKIERSIRFEVCNVFVSYISTDEYDSKFHHRNTYYTDPSRKSN